MSRQGDRKLQLNAATSPARGRYPLRGRLDRPSKPYYEEDGITIYLGDCEEVLRTLSDGSVNCCVTSPPYWGLRDYGTAEWEGGDAGCDHSGVAARRCDKEGRHDKQSTQRGSSSDHVSRNCLKCAARRIDSQLGLESTPEEYVGRIVEVFREVRRVLRDDGTLWLNLGDSYAAGGGFYANAPSNLNGSKQSTNRGSKHQARTAPEGLKPKDLIGIPWRVAFALQADGWYLRSDIIWHKPNPMPESVTDRPTKAHEYLFLLSKSEQYYYDADSIREPAAQPNRVRSDVIGGANGHTVRHSIGSTFTGSKYRNKHSVWTIPTESYPESHFATFPTALIEPCIKAGTPPGGTVLDPFGGSGTTAQVARALGCKAVLIELNEAYCSLAEKRISQQIFDFFVQPPTEAKCETL